MSGPLADIRIIDFTAIGMGPYATQILGDMGCDVIKIESPEGDPFRHIEPCRHSGMGAAFLNFNRNKRSIALDLRRTEHNAVLTAMLETADVFVSSVRPRSLRKLGLTYAALSARNPRLIYCAILGFSEEGPYAGRPAFDDVIQAMSGLASLQGHNHAEGPQYVNSILADKIGGLATAGAISMALFERERSGVGQAIEVPMYELMTSFTLIEHLAGATFHPNAGEPGYARILSEYRRPYRTRDGYVSLLPYTTAQWQRFFELAGRPEYIHDPRLTDPGERSRYIDEWYRLLTSIVAERTTAEWLTLLSEADIPIAPVQSLSDVLTDPHLRAIGLVREEIHPSEGPITTVGIPVRFSRTAGSIRRPAPSLDEHRDEILREVASYTCEEPS